MLIIFFIGISRARAREIGKPRVDMVAYWLEDTRELRGFIAYR